MTVDPDPAHASRIKSPRRLLNRMARSTRATGFIVGCKRFFLGLGTNQTSPSLRAPHQKWSCPFFQPYRITSYILCRSERPRVKEFFAQITNVDQCPPAEVKARYRVCSSDELIHK